MASVGLYRCDVGRQPTEADPLTLDWAARRRKDYWRFHPHRTRAMVAHPANQATPRGGSCVPIPMSMSRSREQRHRRHRHRGSGATTERDLAPDSANNENTSGESETLFRVPQVSVVQIWRQTSSGHGPGGGGARSRAERARRHRVAQSVRRGGANSNAAKRTKGKNTFTTRGHAAQCAASFQILPPMPRAVHRAAQTNTHGASHSRLSLLRSVSKFVPPNPFRLENAGAQATVLLSACRGPARGSACMAILEARREGLCNGRSTAFPIRERDNDAAMPLQPRGPRHGTPRA